MSGRTNHRTTKTCHRACLFAIADFAVTKKTKSFKDSENGMTELKNYLKPLADKNAQLVTRAKSKRAVSGNLKVIATNKLYRRLTVLCFELPASS